MYMYVRLVSRRFTCTVLGDEASSIHRVCVCMFKRDGRMLSLKILFSAYLSMA